MCRLPLSLLVPDAAGCILPCPVPAPCWLRVEATGSGSVFWGGEAFSRGSVPSLPHHSSTSRVWLFYSHSMSNEVRDHRPDPSTANSPSALPASFAMRPRRRGCYDLLSPRCCPPGGHCEPDNGSVQLRNVASPKGSEKSDFSPYFPNLQTLHGALWNPCLDASEGALLLLDLNPSFPESSTSSATPLVVLVCPSPPAPSSHA